MSLRSPEYQELFDFIASRAIKGDYDTGLRQKRRAEFIGNLFVDSVLCDEGGRSRSVITPDGHHYYLTYVARLDIYGQDASREYWLLNDGRAFSFHMPLDGQTTTMGFIETPDLGDIIAEVGA